MGMIGNRIVNQDKDLAFLSMSNIENSDNNNNKFKALQL